MTISSLTPAVWHCGKTPAKRGAGVKRLLPQQETTPATAAVRQNRCRRIIRCATTLFNYGSPALPTGGGSVRCRTSLRSAGSETTEWPQLARPTRARVCEEVGGRRPLLACLAEPSVFVALRGSVDVLPLGEPSRLLRRAPASGPLRAGGKVRRGRGSRVPGLTFGHTPAKTVAAQRDSAPCTAPHRRFNRS
jgi:hypothetical protein